MMELQAPRRKYLLTLFDKLSATVLESCICNVLVLPCGMNLRRLADFLSALRNIIFLISFSALHV